MNRRQFLGASLSASIASAALPWDPFLAWCEKWLGFVQKRGEQLLTNFSELMKRAYPDDMLDELYDESPMWAMARRLA